MEEQIERTDTHQTCKYIHYREKSELEWVGSEVSSLVQNYGRGGERRGEKERRGGEKKAERRGGGEKERGKRRGEGRMPCFYGSKTKMAA